MQLMHQTCGSASAQVVKSLISACSKVRGLLEASRVMWRSEGQAMLSTFIRAENAGLHEDKRAYGRLQLPGIVPRTSAQTWPQAEPALYI